MRLTADQTQETHNQENGMNLLKRTTGAIAACALLSSCATMELSEEDRAALGGALGAVAGALIANEAGADGWQVALAGIAAGYAGYQIGKRLGGNDQAALRERTAAALSTAGDGEVVEWASDESAATARITTAHSRRETKGMDMLRDQRVSSPAQLTVIGKPYASTGSSVNLRAGPSTATQVVGSLDRGEIVHAFGKVRGAPWVMVGRNNVALGYVHDSLVAEHGAAAAEQKPALTGTFELDDVDMDEVNREARATFEIDDLVTVGDTVEVATDCRTVTLEIVVDGVAETEETDACRGATGAWEAV